MKIEEIIIIVFFIGISSYALYYLFSLSRIKKKILKQLNSKESIAYKSYVKTLKGQKNTFLRAGEIYNLEYLLKVNKVNTRLYLAIPSLLVGLGVLGTFIGFSLTVLSVSDVLDSSNQIESMKKLFDSVKIAFLSSVAGMFWSFVFSKYEKVIFYKLEDKITDVCQRLDEEYFLSHEEYTRGFMNNMENYFESEFNKTFTENINNTFDLINHNFQEKFDVFFEKTTSALKIQAETVERQLANWESLQNEQNKIIVSSVSQLSSLPPLIKSQVDDVAISFSGIEKNIGLTVNNLTAINSEINSYVQSWSSSIQAQAIAVRQQEESISSINAMLAGIPNITKEFGDVNDLFKEIVKSLQKTDRSLREGVEGINSSVTLISQELNTTGKDIHSAVENFSYTLESGNDELKGVVRALDNSLKTVFHGLDNTIDQRLTNTNKLLVDYFSAIDKLSEKIVKTYTATKHE